MTGLIIFICTIVGVIVIGTAVTTVSVIFIYFIVIDPIKKRYGKWQCKNGKHDFYSNNTGSECQNWPCKVKRL